MDIAIHYEKYNLDDEKCVFKPVDIIKGTYNSVSNMFTTESGLVCYPINSSEINENDYFSTPTTMDELREAFGDASEEALISEFLIRARESCYIGEYDYGGPTIIHQVDLCDEGEEYEVSEGTAPQDKIWFDVEELKAMRNAKSLGEVKDKMDLVLGLISQIKGESTIPYEDVEYDQLEEEKNYRVDREKSKSFKEIRKTILDNIIAQDDAVNKVLTRIGMNYVTDNFRNKGHILIAGPTGTGKTEIATMISQELDVPCHSVNATDYTQEGYVGSSVSDMLAGLLYAANYDLEDAEHGILIIDEIDKKSSSGSNSEVSNKAVQDSLLKIAGRGIVEVDYVENGVKKTTNFDTSNLTIFFLGAFEGLEDVVKESKKANAIGFVKSENKSVKPNEILPEHFVKYGMTPELMGRIKCIAFTKKFKTADYIKIANKSKISPLYLKKEFFKEFGTELRYTKGYLEEIAKRAEALGEGARGLDVAISESLSAFENDFLFEDLRPKVLRLTKKTALNPKDYDAK